MTANGDRHGLDSPGAGEPIDMRSAGANASAEARAPVDLAAWGRGEREYLFGEVKLAIDDYILREIDKIVEARFVSLRTPRDAVQWLAKEGLIEAAEARQDV